MNGFTNTSTKGNLRPSESIPFPLPIQKETNMSKTYNIEEIRDMISFHRDQSNEYFRLFNFYREMGFDQVVLDNYQHLFNLHKNRLMIWKVALDKITGKTNS
jgi:hypothetical protein